MLTNPTNAYALPWGDNDKKSIRDSNVAKGTEKLIDDASVWLLGSATAIAVILLIYFLIRRSGADENEIQKWNNRIKVTIISTIGVFSASSIVGVLNYYYGS